MTPNDATVLFVPLTSSIMSTESLSIWTNVESFSSTPIFVVAQNVACILFAATTSTASAFTLTKSSSAAP